MHDSYLADTSFMLAVLDRSDGNHRRSALLYSTIDALLLPTIVLSELAFHLIRLNANRGVVDILTAIERSQVHIVDMRHEDYRRVAEILDRSGDQGIDFADACVIALAERLDITRILTFDRRDFERFRPAHCERFELLP